MADSTHEPPDPGEAVEASLDQLSQAFAEAMGKGAGDVSPASPTEAAAEEGDPVEPAPESSACPITPQSILEAMLFVGHPENEPLSAHAVAKLVRGVEREEVDELVAELNQAYERHHLPIEISSVDDGFRLQLRAEFESVRQRFYGRVRRAKLSQLAVDVLAVVAYNQPLTRQEVDEKLNQPGASSGRVLNQLVRRELLAVQFAKGPPKRREYVTTDRFLELFALESLADLPRSEEPQ